MRISVFVQIINGVFALLHDTRDDRAGANAIKPAQNLAYRERLVGFWISDAREITRFGGVWQNEIRFAAELPHFSHVSFRKARVQLTAVAHYGVYDKFAVWRKKFLFDLGYQRDLTNTPQVSAVNIIKRYAERFPMRQDGGDILGEVAEGIAREPARVCG